MKADMQHLRMISAAGSEIGREKDLQAVLDKVLWWTERIFDLESCAVLLYDERIEALRIAAARGYRPEVVASIRIARGEGVTGRVLATGRTVLVNDVRRAHGYIEGVPGARREMAAPLMADGRVIGVLDAETARARPFSRTDLDLFELFAGHVAAAIHNARLLQEARLVAERLRRRANDLSALNAIGLRMATFTEPDSLLDAAMTLASRSLFFRTCALLLKDGDELVVRAAYGHDKAVVGKRLPKGQGITWRCLLGGHSILVEDVSRDPDYVPGLHDGRCEMAAPILGPEGPVGVLDAESPKPGAFNLDSLMVFETFAHQIAVALENARLHATNRRTFYQTIRALAQVLEARDSYTHGHSERVARYAKAVGEIMGLDRKTLQVLEQASLLHDIGKIGVRDAVLHKPGALDKEERLAIERHPTIGDDILHPVVFLREALEIVRHHHEHWDGTGYPAGLRGEEIPLVARIVAVADAYDAMTSDRPYRRAMAARDALAEIRAKAGIQFDPAVVEAFSKVMETLLP